jgi:hypothetical protein
MIVRLLIDARFAGSRLAGQRSVAGWVGEAMGGLSYLEFIRTLAKRVEEDWQGVQVRCHGGGPWRWTMEVDHGSSSASLKWMTAFAMCMVEESWVLTAHVCTLVLK